MKRAKIVQKRFLGTSFVELWLEEKDIAHLASPGQFVMVTTGSSYDPFLKRPLGILACQENQFGLLFEIVGRGTQILSQLEIGDQVDLLGPLGNGFSLNPKEALLIGGGRGFVPLYFLAQIFINKKVPFQFFFGIRSQEEKVLIEYLSQLPIPLVISCQEEFSGFYCGTVLDAFENWRQQHSLSKSAPKIYACGPQGMFQTLAKMDDIIPNQIEVSLESRMGCGYGVCLSCAVKKKGLPGYFHVCKDGPVFRLGEIEL
ncbi:dihydroorotate dehydrogenase electron transfer subunit [Atribacter laminatus]|jgi:dihydroorotate dehydrogenase electron transfer subunit|uniref:Dihydroorotate dehydrogenase B (NAD(+)), electron transfer subunit n=1 Tax=Atribacter laminatus TaxID=2847778 RepID=A0A7T1AJI7_ATRLM|nr:dihydroorotate dehydrogenase electron transfer subunit [Atribacter laminatus]QPM67084.1 Dihydroorotate dehydrogenase B (NAD(+)), electron transfer subunit [Atribacter laminatus]